MANEFGSIKILRQHPRIEKEETFIIRREALRLYNLHISSTYEDFPFYKYEVLKTSFFAL
jgi:hypothetical protein